MRIDKVTVTAVKICLQFFMHERSQNWLKSAYSLLILKTEYLKNYLVNINETNVVEFRIRCSFHIPNLKKI